MKEIMENLEENDGQDGSIDDQKMKDGINCRK